MSIKLYLKYKFITPLIGFVCLCIVDANAQFYLSIQLDSVTTVNNYNSKEERSNGLNEHLAGLYKLGHLAAGIDTSYKSNDTLYAYISKGKKFNWITLKKGNVDEEALSAVHYKRKLFEGQPLNYSKAVTLQEQLVQYYENRGFPFASVKFDSLEIINDGVSATLDLNKHHFVEIDSLIIIGNARINKTYLENYTGLRTRSPYKEERFLNAGTRLKELPFISVKDVPKVRFTDKHTKVYFFLDKKKASKFDGIVGVLPNENTGQVTITGDVKLKLLNTLGRGELIDLNWRSLAKGTQDLKSTLEYPFLFNTPFGANYYIKLYKKDTSFIDINQTFGVSFLLQGNNYLKAIYKTRQSSLLSTYGLQAISALPPYADIKTNAYGLEFNYTKLDYRLNPKRGYDVKLSFSAGNRNILKNANINPEVYKGLDLRSSQYETFFDGNIYLQLGSNSTVKMRAQHAWVNSSTIFQNELFRIGGIKTLRGFDEESIFTSMYTIGSIEYRYLFAERSFLYTFFDGAYYENLSVSFEGDRYDSPFGFGAGISFETKTGIFTINYALGKQFNNPIYLKSGKVHFGIVNYF